jgi:hypothetical protein
MFLPTIFNREYAHLHRLWFFCGVQNLWGFYRRWKNKKFNALRFYGQSTSTHNFWNWSIIIKHHRCPYHINHYFYYFRRKISTESTSWFKGQPLPLEIGKFMWHKVYIIFDVYKERKCSNFELFSVLSPGNNLSESREFTPSTRTDISD